MCLRVCICACARVCVFSCVRARTPVNSNVALEMNPYTLILFKHEKLTPPPPPTPSSTQNMKQFLGNEISGKAADSFLCERIELLN